MQVYTATTASQWGWAERHKYKDSVGGWQKGGIELSVSFSAYQLSV